MEFTILMPCLNEAETLATCIKKARLAIDQHSLEAEILVTDNGSSDGSVDIAKNLGARVVFAEEQGYGSALRYGIEQAKGKYVIMADADDSYDFRDIFPFVAKLREGNELVIGNRFTGGIEQGAMPFLHRYLGNPVLTFIGKLFFQVGIGDFHCGFRGCCKKAALDMQLHCRGMEFASEMIVSASLRNYKISQVAVKLYPDGRSRPPHLRTWHDGWRHLRFLLLYSPGWIFLYPGLFLSILGASLLTILLPGPIHLGGVFLDVHTMLYASVMLLIGLQIILFYGYSQCWSYRFRPEDTTVWNQYFAKYFSLERGVICGTVLLAAGMGLSSYSVFLWSETSLGDLIPSSMLRIVIPAVTLLMLGVQLIFNSFFVGILGIKTNNQ